MTGPRRATADDVDALLRLRVLMFEAMGTPPAALADATWREAARAWFTTKVDDQRTLVLVVEEASEVLAGGLAEVLPAIPAPTLPHGRLGFVSNVATLPHARGRGFARAVMTELVRWLEEDAGADRVDLAATADGAVIYRSMDFTESAFPTMRRLPADGGR